MIIFLACELWLFHKATRVHSDYPGQILTQGTTQLHRNCCNNSCLWLRLDINFRVIGNPDSSEVFRNNITALGFIKAELFPTGLGESIKARHWTLLALWNFNLPVSHGGWDIFDCHLCNSSYNNFSVENVSCFPIEKRSICVVFSRACVGALNCQVLLLSTRAWKNRPSCPSVLGSPSQKSWCQGIMQDSCSSSHAFRRKSLYHFCSLWYKALDTI